MPILRGPGGRRVRLAYCLNAHAGETLEDVEAALESAARVRERLGLATLGVGLWLTANIARAGAADDALLARIRGWLDERALLAFTANAFPIGGFHAPRVKAEVYRPSWLEHGRARYTSDVARCLARLLPEGEDEATISTVPVAWRGHVHEAAAARRSVEFVLVALRDLARIRSESGKRLRLAFEPEPGCVVETTDEAIALHAEIGAACGAEAHLARDHVALCFDCCHQAVMGEDLPRSLARLRTAGAPVAKMHLSSAVAGAVADLAPLAEPRWLHQVVCDDGRRADDLETVARDPAWQAARARCHFHVPIYAERLASGLATTRGALAAAIDVALDGPGPAPDLEVETYTWSVLPEGERPAGIVEGIALEMEWALARLEERGYSPC
jgi:hypothetical protein